MNRMPAKSYLPILVLCLSAMLGAGFFYHPAAEAAPLLSGRGVINFSGDTSEKLIAVDARVAVQLCVTQGNLKVNGWKRNEVRVFVRDGSKIGFKVLQKSNREASLPVWIAIMGEQTRTRHGQPSECLWGSDIEIDLPFDASISVKADETTTMIDSVRKASVKNVGGDISLRNIGEGVQAATYEGDVTVESSGGGIALESANGNIVAYGLSPSQIGDTFKAKTNNGAISLQNLEHRQIEVNSISGSVVFHGTFSAGGQYNFTTSKGTITLAIPANSSCKIVALYGYGAFNSEIPLKYLTEDITSELKRVVAQIGAGDATLNLTTAHGSIRIKKQ